MVQSMGGHISAVGNKRRSQRPSSRNLSQSSSRNLSHGGSASTQRSRSRSPSSMVAGSAIIEEAAAAEAAAAAGAGASPDDSGDVVGPLRRPRGSGGGSGSGGGGAPVPQAAKTKGNVGGGGGGGQNGTAFEESGETSVTAGSNTLHQHERLSAQSSGDSAAGGGGGSGGGGGGGGGGIGPAATSVVLSVTGGAAGPLQRFRGGGGGGGSGDSAPPRPKPVWVQKTLRVVQHYRQICGRIVNDDRVQLFVVILITVNAIMMGIATFDFVTENPEVDSAFELCDQVFLIIFTVELAMQFVYYGFRLFLDGWLVFDFVIILLSWAFASAQIIRAFRIFRALRLVTRVEVMRNLIVALFGVMPRMAAIGLLLFLIFYIFAVMFTQLFKDMWHDRETDFDYFSRMDSTFFTLFQIMTLDEWSAVARDVMDTYSWAWAPFVVFVILTGFVVVNLIIAVICDAIAALHEDDRAKLHGTYDVSEFEVTSQAGGADEASSPGGGGGGSPTDNPRRGGRRRSSTEDRRRGSSLRSSDAADGMLVSGDAKRQIEALEGQVKELVRVQERSMRTLEALTRHVQIKKMKDPMDMTRTKDSMENSMSVVDLG